MCVEGPLGNSATYLTRDVPTWVHEHLHAAAGGADWAIAGFSQGGTCALQLGAGRPDRFGSWIDVSGQIGPVLQGRDDTVSRGFRGDRAAYEAAQPLRVLAERARTATPPRSSRPVRTTAGTDRSSRGSWRPHVQPASR